MICFSTEYVPIMNHLLFPQLSFMTNKVYVSLMLHAHYRCMLCFWFSRYNLHATKLTLLNYTIQRFIVYSRGCATVTTNFLEHFHHSEKNPEPISSHSPFHHYPSTWQPLIDFQSAEIFLFWTFHIYGPI